MTCFITHISQDESVMSVVFSPCDPLQEIDVRAGGGQTTTVGQIVRHMLSKLDWYSTLFPRIPVPIQKDLEKKLAERDTTWPPAPAANTNANVQATPAAGTPSRKDWYAGGGGGSGGGGGGGGGRQQDPDPSRDPARESGRGYE